MIVIHLHYSRADGAYQQILPDGTRGTWNLYAWSSAMKRQIDLVKHGAYMDATLQVDGRQLLQLNFKPRLSTPENLWAREEAQVTLNLQDFVSGTVEMFLHSENGKLSVRKEPGQDLIRENKLTSVSVDYDRNLICVESVSPIAHPARELKLVNAEEADDLYAQDVLKEGETYLIKPSRRLELSTLHQLKVRFVSQPSSPDYNYPIAIHPAYSSRRFAREFTYTGTDLGVFYRRSQSVFRVWAPTAQKVWLKLYATGSSSEPGAVDLGKYTMTRGDKGTWTVTVPGDLNGVYYTYCVSRHGQTVEACDPYARATGVNGLRAMVLDLRSTDPEDPAFAVNPNPLRSYTDAVLYELHVRDLSIHESAGVKAPLRGKYLALTQSGTTTAGGSPTCLDHIKALGVTHVHLLPVYDFGSVNEATLDIPQYNWGYDPLNYNTPEGSYATDPFDGAVRVREMKAAIAALHARGLSVVMDVVYNHVYNENSFCFNQIVPGYFSRHDSNGSGCGNDTASERAMVHKFIVESVLYWAREYHIDGFRFDLVGLLDAATINDIVSTVHAQLGKGILFYGEGWSMDTKVPQGTVMATQLNSYATPGFAYFSDTIRDLLAGRNGQGLGFVSGKPGLEGKIADCILARPGWSSEPQQIVQYCSCHDNYTLADKLLVSTGRKDVDETVLRMNKLTAAIYLLSQGIPFIHAGEEFLRQKRRSDGSRCENSYNSPDYVNQLRWDALDAKWSHGLCRYYQGLIALRKAHGALRLPTAAEVSLRVRCERAQDGLVLIRVDGTGLPGENSHLLLLAFNAAPAPRMISLPQGNWDVLADALEAGATPLYTLSGRIAIEPVSALVLSEHADK